MIESNQASAIADETSASTSAFTQMGLGDELCHALHMDGYHTPTAIQAATIPALLAGQDVLGQAQTGTGKTAAFALPLLNKILVDQSHTQVLVLTPTRELAIQVAESFERYGRHLRGLRIAAVYGGSAYASQIQALRKGAHVVVGTPGRVMDHMREGRLRIEQLHCLVLDEADEMLRMGFVDDVRWVLEQAPKSVQMALFSATMPNAIREIADQHLETPHVVSIDAKTRTADTIRQRYIVVEPKYKFEALERVLEMEKTDGVIVFVKTRAATVELTESLIQSGYSAVAINGEIAQNQRERTIEQLKQGSIDILVATDVAARGLDVQRITHVINFDLPFDTEAYIHRIGRTGRAGRDGEAIVFVTPRQRGFLRDIHRTLGTQIQSMEVPTTREINAARTERFVEKVTSICTQSVARSTGTSGSKPNLYETLVANCVAKGPFDINQVAAALAQLATGNRPFFLEESERDRRPSIRDELRSNERGRRRDHVHSSFDSSSGSIGTDDRPRGDNRRRRERGGEDYPKEKFRVEVGRDHGVKPGNLVGAIANETGLDSANIGQITIYDDHSTVYLPTGMPRELFKTLGRAWVVGRQLRISKWRDSFRDPDFRPASEMKTNQPRTEEAANQEPRKKKKKKKISDAASIVESVLSTEP